jgi:hypothetical protein
MRGFDPSIVFFKGEAADYQSEEELAEQSYCMTSVFRLL